jgi:valyl-tRNA synthetase
MMNVEDLSSSDLMKPLNFNLLSLQDRWILSVLNRTIEEIGHHFENYAFDKLSHRSYEFFWNDFCAVYVELCKPVLFGKTGTLEEKVQKQKLLVVILMNAIRLLHPIAPFITEEIFQTLKTHFPHLSLKEEDPYTKDLLEALLSPACIVAPFPKVIRSQDIDPIKEKEFELMLELVRSVRNIRTEMQIPPSEKTELYVIGKESSLEFKKVVNSETILLSLTPTSKIIFQSQKPNLFGAEVNTQELTLFIPIPETLKEKEKLRLHKEKEKLQKGIISTLTKLENPEFCARAPQEIVQNLKQTLSDSEKLLKEVLMKIDAL